MSLPIEQMLKDVEVALKAIRNYRRPIEPEVADLCCHVKALAAEVERKDKALKLVFETVASDFGSETVEQRSPDDPWLPAGVLLEVLGAIES